MCRGVSFVPNFPLRLQSKFLSLPLRDFHQRCTLPVRRSSSIISIPDYRSFPISAADDSSVNVSNKQPVPLAPPASDVWELDFYSRPVVGFDGKKLWELLITDSTGTFEFVDVVPNTLVNSRELRKRVEAAMDIATRKPTVIRFFRSQMFNMIQIALSELDVIVSPSRKTYALYKLIKYRESKVYRKMPGFKPSAAGSSKSSISSLSQPSFSGINFPVSQPLPDALRCEKFAFGTFPITYLQRFFKEADPSEYFGDQCPVDDDTPSDLEVPGLIVFSKRAKALAAWIGGIELAFIRVLQEQREVVMECELDKVYRFIQITKDVKKDVTDFENRKNSANGLHFLAVQRSAESDEVEGMWLLSEI